MAGFGETLRQARAHKGVSLKEAEQATRITRHYLAALEEEDFSSLPPVIYQRGFVRNYSIFLDLDPSKTLTLFEEAQGTVSRPADQGVTAVPPIDMPSHWAPNFAIIAFSVVLSAIVFAWVYTAYVAPPTDPDTATPAQATVTEISRDIAMPTQPKSTETPQPSATTDSSTVAPEATEANSSGGDNQISASTDPTEEPATGAGDNVADTEDPATEAPEATATVDATAEPTQYTKVGEFDTTIDITAQSDIYVSFWTDGILVFDGDLSAGESTGAFPGSTFKIYTSVGADTLFTNGCDEEFTYGNETGEVTYEFGAGPDSCEVDPTKLDD